MGWSDNARVVATQLTVDAYSTLLMVGGLLHLWQRGCPPVAERGKSWAVRGCSAVAQDDRRRPPGARTDRS
jgi:hypothetical protein